MSFRVLALSPLISYIVVAAGLAEGQRPDDPAGTALFRFQDPSAVVSSEGERVRVHYVLSGTDAVPTADNDSSGIPDFVELVIDTYDASLVTYRGAGFREPVSDGVLGGDERFDVYLIDFFGSADGSFQRDPCPEAPCSGYMVQENDFEGYGYSSIDHAVSIVGSHELFHAVHSAYRGEAPTVFSEGMATWASEFYDPNLADFESAIRGYLSEPSRPLSAMSSIILDRFAYGSALFFRYLQERFGVALLVALVETAEDNHWLTALDMLLQGRDSSFEEVFVQFAGWNLQSGFEPFSEATGYENSAHYSRISCASEALPFVDERPRHFSSAARVYCVPIDDRDTIVIAEAGEIEQERALWFVALPVDSSGQVTGMFVTGERELRIVDLGGAVELRVAAVHAATEGNSIRASVCIGNELETERCIHERSVGEDAGADVGPSGGLDAGPGGSVDALFDGSVDGGMMEGSAGGCSASSKAPSFGLWFLFALTLCRWATRRSDRRRG